MTKSVLFTTLAAAALAVGLAACDEQQASENSSVPMQQQGAMPQPAEPDSRTPGAAPTVQPGMVQPEADDSESTLPGSSQ
ncbi:MAG: hypothetical protein ACFB13_17590 [Kiloniellaceae bacterium]